MQNLQRVRRYQHELEDAEGRADQAESSLHLIRAKHRSSVVTGKSSSKVSKPLTYAAAFSETADILSVAPYTYQHHNYLTFSRFSSRKTIIKHQKASSPYPTSNKMLIRCV